MDKDVRLTNAREALHVFEELKDCNDDKSQQWMQERLH